ncbi:CPBP family intramembrane glutamic endopeptidase [Nonomuraea sp. NPDC050310]|uniref:CPBP family intramembrane glutamic endopeptidase n=1 Tax=Nonomuraea sp. NPDC050310 TaxID=3154935 RepID=UPI0033F8BF76
MMATPTIAVLAVWAANRRTTPFRQMATETGLTLGPNRKRTLLILLTAWLGTPVLIVLAFGLSIALGLLPTDLSGMAANLRTAGLPVPENLPLVLTAQIIGSALIGPVLNALPSLGEEWGWRGWLLPRLVETRGVGQAVLISGLIWGAWHAPLTLLGYNYPSLGPWAALMFTGATVLIGALFSWLRLRSGSVWPAVIAHGSLNAVAPMIALFAAPDTPPNYVLAGITGLTGWALMALTAACLFRFWPVRQA